VRLLAYTTPARGHLYPIVPILQELRRRGHEVALRTLPSQVPLMRRLGFEAEPVAPAVAEIELDDYRARTLAGRSRRTLETFLARADHEVGDMAEAIRMHRPDALLIDCLAWGAAAVAEASGAPWAQFAPFPIPLRSTGSPPRGLGLAPAAGLPGRMRDAAIWPAQSTVMNMQLRGRLNRIRRRAGAPCLRSAIDVFVGAPLVLYMSAEPFEFPRETWPAWLRMIGPCAWDPPADLLGDLAGAGDPETDRSSAVRRTSPPIVPGGRPIVLVSTSSEHQRDKRLVRVAFEALAGTEMDVVATMPAHALDGLPVPDNARLESFVPHGPLLAHAVCAITHGGAGITQKALAQGVPVCVVPFGRDQGDVARRVELAGAGVRLPPRSLTPARLADAVSAAIELRDGARRIGEAFAAAGGAVAGASAIEGIAG
jgi:UDP:flavonoid glycosyltransferase YjiC (YdhE family)